MKVHEMQEEILRLKKEKDVCILAHAYQSQEILETADFTGDSYGLSLQAAKAPQKNLLLCGVRFMAENLQDPQSGKAGVAGQSPGRLSHGGADDSGDPAWTEKNSIPAIR